MEIITVIYFKWFELLKNGHRDDDGIPQQTIHGSSISRTQKFWGSLAEFIIQLIINI